MSAEQFMERPKTGHGNRSYSRNQYQQIDQQQYGAERSRTNRANRPKSRLGRESINYQKQVQAAQAAASVPDPYERPGTSRGRRRYPADETTASVDENVAYERPQTSRGFRNTQELSQSAVMQQDYSPYERVDRSAVEPEQEDDYIPFEGNERPTTSRGSRAMASMDFTPRNEPVLEPAQSTGEVNILRLDEDEPGMTAGEAHPQLKQRQNRVSNPTEAALEREKPIEYYVQGTGKKIEHKKSGKRLRSGQTGQEETNVGYSPSPRSTGATPTPSTHNIATRKQAASRRRPSVEMDYSRDQMGAASPAARPESAASLSKYNILPAIGTKSGQIPPRSPYKAHHPTPAAQDPPPDQIASRPTQTPTPAPRAHVTPPVPAPRSSTRPGSNLQQREYVTQQDPSSDQSIQSAGLVVEQLPADCNAEVEQLGPIVEALEPGIASVISMDQSEADVPNNVVVIPTGIMPAENSFKPPTRNIDLPAEPQPSEKRVLLAVKLPSGSRVQRYFSYSDSLMTVLNFAEKESQVDFSGCELICDVPKAVYKDLSISLQQSGLVDRTVLHVQVPDE